MVAEAEGVGIEMRCPVCEEEAIQLPAAELFNFYSCSKCGRIFTCIGDVPAWTERSK